MRIRNRKVRLPISSLCPVPIWSDPTSTESSRVQLFHQTDDASDRPSEPTPANETKVLPTENGGGGRSMKDDDFGVTKDSVGTGQCLSPSDKGGGEEKGAKKKGRGGAVLEGSRCSRVNGRGWRCCQPTLVGYALCDHHLGKGRLKSLTHGRKGAKRHVSPPTGSSGASGSSESVQGKRRKLGVVKARSLSSLLAIGLSMDHK